MESKLINIDKLRNNTGQIKGVPANPRIIKDSDYERLVKSIQDDPEMLELREVIAYPVGKELIVIMGNQRLKACRELGYKEIPCKILPKETPVNKLKAYLIKDNNSFGEYDFVMLCNDWEEKELNEFGVKLLQSGSDFNKMTEDDLDFSEEFNPVGIASGLQRVVFLFDGPDEAEKYLNNLEVKFEKRNLAWQVNMSSRYIS